MIAGTLSGCGFVAFLCRWCRFDQPPAAVAKLPSGLSENGQAPGTPFARGKLLRRLSQTSGSDGFTLVPFTSLFPALVNHFERFSNRSQIANGDV